MEISVLRPSRASHHSHQGLYGHDGLHCHRSIIGISDITMSRPSWTSQSTRAALYVHGKLHRPQCHIYSTGKYLARSSWTHGRGTSESSVPSRTCKHHSSQHQEHRKSWNNAIGVVWTVAVSPLFLVFGQTCVFGVIFAADIIPFFLKSPCIPGLYQSPLCICF